MQQLSHQFLLKRASMDIIGEQAQHICQLVISQTLRIQVVYSAPLQSFQLLVPPLLHAIHPIARGYELANSRSIHPRLAVVVGWDMLIQQFCHMYALNVSEQQQDIIRSFCFNAEGFFHAFSLSESCYCVQI